MSEGTPADSPYASPRTTDAPPSAAGEVASPDERVWALLAHLAGLLGWAAGLGQIVAPLVIYLIYKDKSKFVAFHALQSLFFQLALHIGLLVVWTIASLTCVGLVVAIPVSIVVGIADLILIIVASIKSYNGEWYEYPWIGRYARQQVGI